MRTAAAACHVLCRSNVLLLVRETHLSCEKSFWHTSTSEPAIWKFVNHSFTLLFISLLYTWCTRIVFLLYMFKYILSRAVFFRCLLCASSDSMLPPADHCRVLLHFQSVYPTKPYAISGSSGIWDVKAMLLVLHRLHHLHSDIGFNQALLVISLIICCVNLSSPPF
jgi:hypothetical protein